MAAGGQKGGQYGQGRLPHSTQTPSGPMMPMQLSSEQSWRRPLLALEAAANPPLDF
jgi:hypothetical protein